MVFDITQLKKIRKQLDLTQHQFAKKAGISQSMVAKIESSKLDPTYSHIKKIESAIELLTKSSEAEARDIMNNKVFTVSKKEKIEKIIALMTKHSISQVPVTEKEVVIGLVTESDLIEHRQDNLTTAKDVMKETPPIIAKNAKISVIIQLLKFYPIVLVKASGKLEGVITKADILKRLQ